MIRGVGLSVMVMLLTAGGCTANGAPTMSQSTTLPVTVIAEAQHCGNHSQPAVSRIGSSDQLPRLDDRSGIVESMPETDFNSQQLILLRMGQQPTPGYGLANPEARLDAGTLHITVDWQSPPPGLLQAQVITYPCLLIALPQETFEQIEVRDRDGQLRMTGHGSR